MFNNYVGYRQSNDRKTLVQLRMSTSNKDSSFATRGISGTGSYLDNLSASSAVTSSANGWNYSNSQSTTAQVISLVDDRMYANAYGNYPSNSVASNAGASFSMSGLDRYSPDDARVSYSSQHGVGDKGQSSARGGMGSYLDNLSLTSAGVSNIRNGFHQDSVAMDTPPAITTAVGSYLENLSSDSSSTKFISQGDAANSRQPPAPSKIGSYMDSLSLSSGGADTVKNGVPQSSANILNPIFATSDSVPLVDSYVGGSSDIYVSSKSMSSSVNGFDISGSARKVSVTDSYLDYLSFKNGAAEPLDDGPSARNSYLDRLSSSTTSESSTQKGFTEQVKDPVGTTSYLSYLNSLSSNIAEADPVVITVSATPERSEQTSSYILQLILTSSISLALGMGIPIQFISRINPFSIPLDSLQARVKEIMKSDFRTLDPTEFLTEMRDLDSADEVVGTDPDEFLQAGDETSDSATNSYIKGISSLEAVVPKDLPLQAESSVSIIDRSPDDFIGSNVAPSASLEPEVLASSGTEKTNTQDTAKNEVTNLFGSIVDVRPEESGRSSKATITEPEAVPGTKSSDVGSKGDGGLMGKDLTLVGDSEALIPKGTIVDSKTSAEGQDLNPAGEDLASKDESKNADIIPKIEDSTVSRYYKKVSPLGTTVKSDEVPLTNVLSKEDNIVPSSYSSPDGEDVSKAIDGVSSTKYLNFKKLNTGFTVTPSTGPSIISAISITTADDYPERDPVSWKIFGSNNDVDYEEIASGSVKSTTERFHTETMAFLNSKSYTSYKIVFPSVADPALANSMQVAEVSLIGKTLR